MKKHILPRGIIFLFIVLANCVLSRDFDWRFGLRMLLGIVLFGGIIVIDTILLSMNRKENRKEIGYNLLFLMCGIPMLLLICFILLQVLF